MRKRGHKTIATQADTISLNFYYKNGFIEFQKKSNKLERQPREHEIDEHDFEKNPAEQYKRYEPWLDYIEDYYSSVLLVYRIHEKADFGAFREIVKKQK